LKNTSTKDSPWWGFELPTVIWIKFIKVHFFQSILCIFQIKNLKSIPFVWFQVKKLKTMSWGEGTPAITPWMDLNLNLSCILICLANPYNRTTSAVLLHFSRIFLPWGGFEPPTETWTQVVLRFSWPNFTTNRNYLFSVDFCSFGTYYNIN